MILGVGLESVAGNIEVNKTPYPSINNPQFKFS